jgi:hypothetical protein
MQKEQTMTERAIDSLGLGDHDRAWLDRLEPGDEVIVQENGRDCLALVHQRLPSGVFRVSWDGGTHEFNFDGRLRTSGTYTATYLVEPTPYRKDMIEKQELAHYLANQQWHHVPIGMLRQIADLLQNA